ncbi:hypothetical protein BDP27DRAFT_144272 [Rhodocollybia butyracea]|uniref:Uncharacterized protein n=1 Tax=Rhodocollybia butyracea TaxID=206335 RepID=A0A9P5Q5W2_9AGAR|nr:hypothetical protein BDP27DRAFT_144272 [Rhodocollybia butyracea]
MQFKQLTLVDNVGVGIEIVGDLAALVVRDLSFGHHIRDKVLILDWKRGIVRAELYTNSRRYQSAIFLTPDIVLVTNAHERCLEIWRIPAINETATMPFICGTPELSLAMPAIHPGFVVSEFACRGAPNPALTIPNTSRPFHSSATTAILVFHLTISPIDPRVPIPFIFFAHRKTFLDLLATAAAGKELSNSNESLNPLSPTSNTIPVLAPPIPWSAWGRPVTRWLHARNIPTEWITSTSGQRFAFVSTHAPALPQPIVVLDFNEHHVKKVTADQKNDLPPYHGAFTPSKVLRESQTQTGHTGNVTNTTNTTASIAIESIDDSQRKLWRRVWLETVPDAYAKMAVFREEVGGHLPYVAVKSEKLYDFHGVLMDDERIIGIKRNRVLSGVESIEVIHMG